MLGFVAYKTSGFWIFLPIAIPVTLFVILETVYHLKKPIESDLWRVISAVFTIYFITFFLLLFLSKGRL
ncbi:MAG: hypothetical protein WC569_02780 [Candidatus Omnitrophota bacterium]